MTAPSHLAHELAAFMQQRPSLLAEHGTGKFALFIGGMFQGAFADKPQRNLILERASRLYAFSVYPFRT